MTQQELQAELEALRAENAALKAAKAKQANAKISLKVSAKGAVSMYGLGRFPVTLYAGQWAKVLEQADTLREFVVEHAAELAVKGEATVAA